MRQTGQVFKRGKATELKKRKSRINCTGHTILSEPELGQRNRGREDKRWKGQEEVQ
jgi:hypothetical protein